MNAPIWWWWMNAMVGKRCMQMDMNDVMKEDEMQFFLSKTNMISYWILFKVGFWRPLFMKVLNDLQSMVVYCTCWKSCMLSCNLRFVNIPLWPRIRSFVTPVTFEEVIVVSKVLHIDSIWLYLSLKRISKVLMLPRQNEVEAVCCIASGCPWFSLISMALILSFPIMVVSFCSTLWYLVSCEYNLFFEFHSGKLIPFSSTNEVVPDLQQQMTM